MLIREEDNVSLNHQREKTSRKSLIEEELNLLIYIF